MILIRSPPPPPPPRVFFLFVFSPFLGLVLDADRLVTTDRHWPFAATLGFEGELLVI